LPACKGNQSVCEGDKGWKATHEFENTKNSVDVPPPIRREPLRRRAHLRRHPQLELVVGDLEESEKLASENPDVRLVDESVREFESTTTNRDIAVAKAVEDDSAVTLDGVRVHRDNLEKGVEGDVANVVVAVAEELSENVDRHHPQTAVRLNLENRQDRLVKDRVSDVLGRLGVGGDLFRGER
jgi:hypothetical protein